MLVKSIFSYRYSMLRMENPVSLVLPGVEGVLLAGCLSGRTCDADEEGATGQFGMPPSAMKLNGAQVRGLKRDLPVGVICVCRKSKFRAVGVKIGQLALVLGGP
jgi:hypothetical protein